MGAASSSTANIPLVLDTRQLALIESVHRGFLYQHLFAISCLFGAKAAGARSLVVESDEDVEIELAGSRIYVQVKTRSKPLSIGDIESALQRFTALRQEHAAHRREGTARFVIASNAVPSSALSKKLNEPSWPSDVAVHWPGGKAVPEAPLPRPWLSVAEALIESRDIAAALPFSLLAPETLVWKLAGRIMAAAAGVSPHANHTFKIESLPELFEQLVVQLQDFPAPPPHYRSQDDEPPLVSQERVRLITGFSGAGKTSWVSQAALQTADTLVYCNVSEVPGTALAATIARELAARLFGKRGGNLGEVLLPGASGPEILFAIGKRLADSGAAATIVIDNAHRAPAGDLKSLIEHSRNCRFILLAQPGPSVALIEATLQIHAKALRGWNNEAIAAEGVMLGCRGDYAAYEQLLHQTAGLPLYVQNALQVAARSYAGNVAQFSRELEAQTHTVETAQELILDRVFADYTPDERDAVAALSLSDVSITQEEASDILRATFSLDDKAVGRLLRKLRTAGSIQIFGVDRFKIHDAMRLLGKKHLETLGSATVRKAQGAIRDLLMATLHREWSRQRVILLLRMFVALGNIKPLVSMATDELFHELGFMPEILEFLENAAQSKDTPAEDRFWALDGLVFAQFKRGDEEGIRKELASMRQLVTEHDLGQSERLAIGMKQMLFSAREGDATAAQAALDETVQLLPDRPEYVRIARYNYAHAMYELGMFNECADETLWLIEQYYDVLGLSLEDVIGKNPDKIEPLLKERENQEDDLKHLADSLDLHAKALNRMGQHSGLSRIHAMKFYSMAQALNSYIRVGQDLVDEFIERHDYVGGRDIVEQHLIPTVLKTKLASHIIGVRSQYAVVLAYCGELDRADEEMARLAVYEGGLDGAGKKELGNQRALIQEIRRYPPPPQWQFQLPAGKHRVNAACPCGSGKKFKKCHGKRAT